MRKKPPTSGSPKPGDTAFRWIPRTAPTPTEILAAHETNYTKGHDCFLQSIMQHLKIAAPTVSHHLKELVNADLITTELEGKLLTCSVNPAALGELEGFFARGKVKR